MGPGIDPSLRAQNRSFADVKRRHFLKNLLKVSSSVAAPTILLRKRENLSLADNGCKDHCFWISEIEFCASPDSPRCFPGETEQQIRV